MAEEKREKIALTIPFATLLKIAIAIMIAVAVAKLFTVIVLLIVATLIAIMLDPLAGWMERHGMRRGVAIGVIAAALIAMLLLFLLVIIPLAGKQMIEIGKQLPQIAKRLTQEFPAAAPALQILQPQQKTPAPSQMRAWLTKGLMAGMAAIEGLTAVFFTVVVAIYLLIEGRRAWEWLVSFAPAAQRPKWERTGREVSEVVLAYMRGQVITSAICGAWAFLVLTVLRIPGALVLAVIAFIVDILPVVGTILMTVPAVLIAMTVSPLRGLLVVGAYMLYHLVENYFIVPRIYGDQMRLSKLAVLIAFAVGGTLQGATGAILILPFVAAYPIIERIWLRDKLPGDTVARHEAIEEA